jgi:hypothetical protein
MKTLIVMYKEANPPYVVEQGTRESLVARLCMDGYAQVATVETELGARDFVRLIESRRQKEVDSLKDTIRDIWSVLRRSI